MIIGAKGAGQAVRPALFFSYFRRAKSSKEPASLNVIDYRLYEGKNSGQF